MSCLKNNTYGKREKVLSFPQGTETAFRFWSFCQWNPLQNHHQIPHMGIVSFGINSSNKPHGNLSITALPPPDPQTFAKGQSLHGVLGKGQGFLTLWDRWSFYLFFLRQPDFLQTLITHLQHHIGGHLCFWNDDLPQASKKNSIFHSKYIRWQNSSTIRMTVVIILLLLSKPQLLLSSLSFYLQ